MKLKPYYLSFFLFLIIFGSCKKNGELKSDVNTSSALISQQLNNSDNLLYLSYDMISTTVVTPVHIQDTSNISDVEKLMRKPINFNGFEVETLVKVNGQLVSEHNRINDERIPEIPQNAIGKKRTPPELITDKIVIENSVSKHYNASGELIHSGFQDEGLEAELAAMLSEITEHVQISDQSFDLIIEAMQDNNFDIQEHPQHSDIFVFNQQNADGTSIDIFINRELKIPTTRIVYDENGNPLTKSDYVYQPSEDPEHPAPKLISHKFITFYENIDNIPMALVRLTKFENYTLQEL